VDCNQVEAVRDEASHIERITLFGDGSNALRL
jgi:hypothetical protein